MKTFLNILATLIAIFAVAFYMHFDKINHMEASVVSAMMLVVSLVIIIKNNIKE